MANTIRTLAALITLLADNTIGLVSEQDTRDMLVSLAMQHGQVWVDGNVVETVIGSTGVFVEADVTGAALSEQSAILGTDDFDMPAAGRLRYLGTETRTFHCACSVSFTSPSNNQEIHMQIGKNGVADVRSEVRRKIGTGTDVGSVAMHLIVSLAPNDYLNIEIKNVTSTANVTVIASNLQAMGMIM